MPVIIIIDRFGQKLEHNAEVGSSLMELLHRLDMVDAVCGGGASCGTCAVQVELPWVQYLPPPEDAESLLLTALDYEQIGGRLSCQLIATEDMAGLCLRVLSPL